MNAIDEQVHLGILKKIENFESVLINIFKDKTGQKITPEWILNAVRTRNPEFVDYANWLTLIVLLKHHNSFNQFSASDKFAMLLCTYLKVEALQQQLKKGAELEK